MAAAAAADEPMDMCDMCAEEEQDGFPPAPAASLPRSPSGQSWLLPPSMHAQDEESRASPPLVRHALVAAAARITTPDSFANPRQLIRVDGAPVIIHLLRNLQVCGIQRAVITLGHAAQLLAAEVKQHSFGEMAVEFVWCEASSWKRGHASNILAARSMFPHDEPLLLVMSDHIFDQRLLRKCCQAQLPPHFATVLVDDSEAMSTWAKPGGVHCQAHCKHGHCGSLVSTERGGGGRWEARTPPRKAAAAAAAAAASRPPSPRPPPPPPARAPAPPPSTRRRSPS